MPSIARVPAYRRARFHRVALVMVATLLIIAAHPAGSMAVGVSIRIGDSGFEPASITVAPGTTVTWTNRSSDRHRVRTESGPTRFDSGNLEPGERFSVTLSAVGTHVYNDHRDPEDRAFWARIVVATKGATVGGASDGGSDGSDGGSAGAGPGGAGGASAPGSTAEVGMADRAFGPSTVEIAAGGTVTFRNHDDDEHTVTATDGAFDSGSMGSGAVYERTFDSPGSFAFLCVFHPDMTGTVVVTAPGSGGATDRGQAPTPTATPTPTVAPPSSEPIAPTPPADARPAVAGPFAIRDFAFDPSVIELVAGTAVEFVNEGQAPHTVTDVGGTFDSGFIAAGDTWSATFTTPGRFDILCTIHPDMTGVLDVVASGAGIGATPGAAAVAVDVGGQDGASAAGADHDAPEVAEVAEAAEAAAITATGHAPASSPADLAGVVLAIALTGVGAVLFARTISGAVRRPDRI